MKIGGFVYRNGIRMGEIVYISAMASPDSQNPQFLTTDKATQYSIMINAPLPIDPDLNSNRWEVGDDHSKRRIYVVTTGNLGDRQTKMVVNLPSTF